MIGWTLEKVSIKDLKPNPRNPRQMSRDHAIKLEGLLKKFGLIDKIIINQDYTIIGGHQRVRLLKKMKKKEVECWVPDRQLSQQDLDELCIGLNLNQGSWDYDILANEYEPIDLLRYGFKEEQLLGKMEEQEESKETVTALLNESEEIEDKEKKTKTHMCPQCGYEFKK